MALNQNANFPAQIYDFKNSIKQHQKIIIHWKFPMRFMIFFNPLPKLQHVLIFSMIYRKSERKIRLEISQISFLLRFWRSKCDLKNIGQKKMNFWKTFRKISWKQNFHNFHKLTLPWIVNYNLELCWLCAEGA